MIAKYYKKYDEDVIKIPKPKSHIIKFYLTAYPENSYRERELNIREIDTKEYIVKNSNADYFTIDIPQLSYQFITYRRLHKDIVLIKNKTTLEWDDNIYSK
jgi:hypothetical protein